MLPTTVRSRLAAPDRRHQLLEAALEVFSRRGFDGTTTKEVAAAAGVTEAIIFRHFPSKQALYAAVLDHRAQSPEVQEALAEIKSWMERNDDEQVLRSVARSILKNYRSDPRYERVLLFAALEGYEQGLAHNRELSWPVFELLEHYFARRKGEGAIGDLPTGAIIGAIGGMTKSYAMVTELFGYASGVPDEKVIESFVCIMMNGIRPTRGGEMESSK